MRLILTAIAVMVLIGCAHGRGEAPVHVIEPQDEAEAGPIEPGDPIIGEDG